MHSRAPIPWGAHGVTIDGIRRVHRSRAGIRASAS
jgi:hypothetical protein